MTTRRRHELVRVVGQIQMLTRKLQNLRQREAETPEVDAEERMVERLRRQLTAVAQRPATDDLLDAA
jgi:hypothetical protein